MPPNTKNHNGLLCARYGAITPRSPGPFKSLLKRQALVFFEGYLRVCVGAGRGKLLGVYILGEVKLLSGLHEKGLRVKSSLTVSFLKVSL